MKYIILTYGSQKHYDMMSGRDASQPAMTPEAFAPMHAFMQTFNQELADSGELVDTRALDAPVHTRRVQLRNGIPVVTDGPYAETQEVLAGYWIVECKSFDRAVEIAARLAKCPSPGDVFADGVADVRPIADYSGALEM